MLIHLSNKTFLQQHHFCQQKHCQQPAGIKLDECSFFLSRLDKIYTYQYFFLLFTFIFFPLNPNLTVELVFFLFSFFFFRLKLLYFLQQLLQLFLLMKLFVVKNVILIPSLVKVMLLQHLLLHLHPFD